MAGPQAKPYLLDSIRRSFNQSTKKNKESLSTKVKNSYDAWANARLDGDSTSLEEFTGSPALVRSGSGKSKNSKSECYKVELVVIGAHSLAARDSNGLSDPYCKVKVGPQRSRTKVCHRNLNPLWEETFNFTVETLEDTLRLKVMDYDRGFRDDLIGYYEIQLNHFPHDDMYSFTEDLIDENNSSEKLGSIKFSILINSEYSSSPLPIDDSKQTEEVPAKTKEERRPFNKKISNDSISCYMNKFFSADTPTSTDSNKLDDREHQRSTSPFQEKHLSGVLSITLLEACNLRPMNKDGSSDPYCKFKLGNQKYKSKTLRRTLDPVWKERFEIRVYSDSSNILEITVYDEEFGFSDNFIGSAEVDIEELEESKTYKKDLELDKDGGKLVCLLNLSRINEKDIDKGCDLSAEDLIDLRKTYTLSYNPLTYYGYTWNNVHDVGVLVVKIIKCIDLPESEIIGSSDPFVIIEVENTRVRTPTLYKTVDPIWNKQFKFNIKDVHSTLNITVFDEEKNKYNLLGCLKIPLLEAHTVHRCLLKDRKLENKGFGEIFLETELIYNPLHASIKTLLPKEEIYMYEEPKFKRNLFMQNFKRVYALATMALSLGLMIQRIYNWENKPKSFFALIAFIGLVFTFELYMVPMFAAILIIYQFFLRWVGFKNYETWVLNPDGSDLVPKDDESEDSEDFSITAKMKMVMGVCQTVQNSLDLVASYCERIKNVFNWTIPFLTTMAVTFLTLGTILLYFIPLRWLVLVWGINKLTVKLRDPDYEENQEALNYLSRLPSDVELNQMRIMSKDHTKAKRQAMKSRRHK